MSMGILDEVFNLDTYEDESIPLKEAPDDEQPSGADDAPAEDTGNDDNAADNNTEDAPQDQTDDQQGEDQGNDDQQDNFDIDTDTNDGEEGQDGENPDDAGDDSGTDNTADDSGEASEESQSQKDQYDQLYKELTPEERAYRDMVLKNEYKDLHSLCGSILMQTGYFPNVSDTQDILKRLIKSLQNFRKYIAFYITNVYNTKSFFENRYQYEVYLQIFNGIKNVFESLQKMLSHENDDKTSK